MYVYKYLKGLAAEKQQAKILLMPKYGHAQFKIQTADWAERLPHCTSSGLPLHLLHPGSIFAALTTFPPNSFSWQLHLTPEATELINEYLYDWTETPPNHRASHPSIGGDYFNTII